MSKYEEIMLAMMAKKLGIDLSEFSELLNSDKEEEKVTVYKTWRGYKNARNEYVAKHKSANKTVADLYEEFDKIASYTKKDGTKYSFKRQ